MKSWDESAAICASYSATLAKIESAAENNFILSIINNQQNRWAPAWFGARRIGGIFRYQDNTLLKYSNWYIVNGQPDRDGDCAEIVKNVSYTQPGWAGHPGGVWNDYPCSGKRAVLCQKSAESQCLCHEGYGNYCGSRKDYGYLSGSCKRYTLYYCPGANGAPAASKGNCGFNCLEHSIVGLDSCPLRKKYF